MGGAPQETGVDVEHHDYVIVGTGVCGIFQLIRLLEMGADATDIGLTIHPHPTLSETVFFASEIAEGSITDLYIPKR